MKNLPIITNKLTYGITSFELIPNEYPEGYAYKHALRIYHVPIYNQKPEVYNNLYFKHLMLNYDFEGDFKDLRYSDIEEKNKELTATYIRGEYIVDYMLNNNLKEIQVFEVIDYIYTFFIFPKDAAAYLRLNATLNEHPKDDKPPLTRKLTELQYINAFGLNLLEKSMDTMFSLEIKNES